MAEELDSAENDLAQRMAVNASQILPHLYVGNYASSTKEAFLQERNIKFILNLTHDKHIFTRINGVEYLNIPLHDLEVESIGKHFETTHAFIEQARANESCVLVHCHRGVSRACTIAMAHLMQLNGAGELRRRSLKEAFHFVKSRRTIAYPNEGFFFQLQTFEKRVRGSDESTMSEEDYSEALYDWYE